ncbi:MAG: choice-of-anchor E domain-containing protein [Pseudomonadota bacterium]
MCVDTIRRWGVAAGVILGATLGTVAPAGAETITQMRSFVVPFSNPPGNQPDSRISTDLIFDGFDPTLGTLEEVRLLLDISSISGFDFSCRTTLTACTNVGITTIIRADLGPGLSPVVVDGDTFPIGDVPDGLDVSFDRGVAFSQFESEETAADPSDFIGATVALGVESRTFLSVSIFGAGTTSDVTRHDFDGTATLTYEFTPAPPSVPLPASGPILLAGMAALGLFALRRPA